MELGFLFQRGNLFVHEQQEQIAHTTLCMPLHSWCYSEQPGYRHSINCTYVMYVIHMVKRIYQASFYKTWRTGNEVANLDSYCWSCCTLILSKVFHPKLDLIVNAASWVNFTPDNLHPDCKQRWWLGFLTPVRTLCLQRIPYTL